MARPVAAGIRERILAVATALFYEQGVRAVGMQQIVAEAECGKNLLYGHFPGKVDLVAAYLREARRDRDASTTRAVAAATDPAARLVALTSEVARTVQQVGYRGCAFRNYLAEFADWDDEPGLLALSYLRDTRSQIVQLAGEVAGADQGLLGDQIWLVIEGLHAAGAHPGRDRAAQAAAPLVRHLLTAAGVAH